MLAADQSLFRPAARLSFAHLQLPLWLFQNDCAALSMNARVVYAFLLSRFRLSQTNSQSRPGSWVNEEGALYIVYPRAQIAEDLHISLNSACACMKELTSANLIAEDRKGQGKANRIYLVDSPLLHSVSCETTASPENPAEPTRTEPKTASAPTDSALSSAENGETTPENAPESQDSIFFTSSPQDSGMLNSTSSESQKTEPKYNNTSNNEEKYNKKNNNPDFSTTTTARVPRASSPSPSTEKTETKNRQKTELAKICEDSGLESLRNPAYGYTEQNYKLMREAVHYLYFLGSLSLQDACYSQEYVRQRMHEITVETFDMALERIRQRPQKIRKIVAYAAKTLFSCIMEQEAEGTLEPDASGESKAPSGTLQEALFSEMGENRKPTVSESKLLAYAEENGFSPENIRELVRETVKRNGSFRVGAARGILCEWNQKASTNEVVVVENKAYTNKSACGEWEREWIESVRAYEQQRSMEA